MAFLYTFTGLTVGGMAWMAIWVGCSESTYGDCRNPPSLLRTESGPQASCDVGRRTLSMRPNRSTKAEGGGGLYRSNPAQRQLARAEATIQRKDGDTMVD